MLADMSFPKVGFFIFIFIFIFLEVVYNIKILFYNVK